VLASLAAFPSLQKFKALQVAYSHESFCSVGLTYHKEIKNNLNKFLAKKTVLLTYEEDPYGTNWVPTKNL
jgi:hypothetical protein